MNDGRKLTAEVKEKILEYVADGLSRGAIARGMGFHVAQIGRMAKIDPAFGEALLMAELDFERHHVKRIGLGESQWQSSAWILQKKWPSRYCEKKPKTDEQFTPAQLMAMAKSLVSATPPPGAVPSMEQPGEIQDDSRGATGGENGTVRKAPPGAVAAGHAPEPAPVV